MPKAWGPRVVINPARVSSFALMRRKGAVFVLTSNVHSYQPGPKQPASGGRDVVKGSRWMRWFTWRARGTGRADGSWRTYPGLLSICAFSILGKKCAFFKHYLQIKQNKTAWYFASSIAVTNASLNQTEGRRAPRLSDQD